MPTCRLCARLLDDEAVFCPACGTPVNGALECTEEVYEAFISYRHLPRDRAIAIRLQKALEGMHVPKEIQRANDAPKHLGKLFRAEDELPTSSSLNDQIRVALKHSRFLVVVCSPQTSDSLWVLREVELFASFHGRDRILIALASGEPQESFPFLLQSHLAQDESGQMQSVPDEPLAADFREDSRRSFRSEYLRIAAALMGCGYDDLRQRQRMRRMRLIATTASVVTAISLAFGAFSWHQQTLIAQNLQLAQANESESLAIRSNDLLNHCERMAAMQVALNALPSSSSSNDRPFVPSAQLALERALGVYPTNKAWQSAYSIDSVEPLYVTSNDGLQAVLHRDGSVQVADITTGVEVSHLDPHSPLTADQPQSYSLVNMFFCGKSLVCVSGQGLTSFNAQTGAPTWSYTGEDGEELELGTNDCIIPSPDGTQIALCSHDDLSTRADIQAILEVRLIEAQNGSVTQKFRLAFEQDRDTEHVVRGSFNDDGTALVIASRSQVHRIDLDTEQVQTGSLSQTEPLAVSFVGTDVATITTDKQVLASFSNTATLDFFDKDLRTIWHSTMDSTTSIVTKEPKSESQALIAGPVPNKDLESKQLLIAFGNRAMLIDLATGKEAHRIEVDQPIRNCIVANDPQDDQKTWVFIVDAAGNAIRRSPVPNPTLGPESSDLNLGEAAEAHFAAVGSDLYLATYDAESTKYRIFMNGSCRGGIEAEPLSSLTGSHAWQRSIADSSCLIGLNDDHMARLDSRSLEPLWSKPITDIGNLTSESYAEMVVCADYAYLYEPYPEEAPEVYALSTQDGSLADTITIDEDATDIDEIQGIAVMEEGQAYNGRRLMMVRNEDTAAFLDLITHELVSTFDLSAFGSARDGFFVGNSLLMRFSTPTGDALVPFSPGNGEPMSCDIRDCQLATREGCVSYAISPQQDTVAVITKEGTLHLYRTTDWTLVHESSEIPPTIRFIAFSPDGQHLIVQDLSGSILLVSSQTGEVLDASSTATAPLTNVYYIDDSTKMIAAEYHTDDVVQNWGTVLISLDIDAFGPVSDLYLCTQVSNDGTSALSYDGVEKHEMRFHRYDLDELINRARTLSDGHELSSAERHLYRLSAQGLS